MPEQIRFKTRVRDAAVQYAPQYYSHFVLCDYLLISDAFSAHPYYIVQAEKDNYLHLVGVSTSLSARSFFDKCLNGTLTEDDFEISSHGQSEKASKGSIRRKIKSLPLIANLVSSSCRVEEDFRRNAVICSFASSDGSCTMGFVATPYARPKTLLSGDELDDSKSEPLKIILSKFRNEEKFETILAGTEDDLAKHFKSVRHLMTQNLVDRISKLLQKENADQTLAEDVHTDVPFNDEDTF
ncbi:MAG: hypothetical protein IJU50_11340 [Lachnospiraceae bacterium]|nr:hypothetical protein [Lachnospiraceae bacterium]